MAKDHCEECDDLSCEEVTPALVGRVHRLLPRLIPYRKTVQIVDDLHLLGYLGYPLVAAVQLAVETFDLDIDDQLLLRHG